jgi:hypothetical protein
MDQDNPAAEEARVKLEEVFIEFIRASINEPDAPIVLDGYVFQLQAIKFDPMEEDGRLPLVWGRKPGQSIVTTLGLYDVLGRNIELEMDDLNDDED